MALVFASVEAVRPETRDAVSEGRDFEGGGEALSRFGLEAEAPSFLLRDLHEQAEAEPLAFPEEPFLASDA